MIRFFRTLRQSLLAENRVSRYMLYAVGEIVLVVIGILLALQVNNWNEARKARIQEIQIYNEILNDLRLTLKEVRKDMDSHIIILKSTQFLIQHISEKRAFTDSVLNAFFDANSDLQVYPKSSGFEALNSIGLDLLSNDSVRIKITDLFQLRLKRVVEVGAIENPRADLSALTSPFIQRYVRADLQAGPVRSVDYTVGATSVYQPMIIDYQEFLEDDELFSVLNNSVVRRSLKIRIHSNAALELEDALQTIQKELERLEPQN